MAFPLSIEVDRIAHSLISDEASPQVLDKQGREMHECSVLLIERHILFVVRDHERDCIECCLVEALRLDISELLTELQRLIHHRLFLLHARSDGLIHIVIDHVFLFILAVEQLQCAVEDNATVLNIDLSAWLVQLEVTLPAELLQVVLCKQSKLLEILEVDRDHTVRNAMPESLELVNVIREQLSQVV